MYNSSSFFRLMMKKGRVDGVSQKLRQNFMHCLFEWHLKQPTHVCTIDRIWNFPLLLYEYDTFSDHIDCLLMNLWVRVFFLTLIILWHPCSKTFQQQRHFCAAEPEIAPSSLPELPCPHWSSPFWAFWSLQCHKYRIKIMIVSIVSIRS